MRDPAFAAPTPLRGAAILRPTIYQLITEKTANNAGFSVASPALNNHRTGWNIPSATGGFNSGGMVRHSWGQVATVTDGRAEWLRMPSYVPNTAAPKDLLELGDCSDDPAKTLWPANPATKLYTRYSTAGGGF
jgi:hypothetical protein